MPTKFQIYVDQSVCADQARPQEPRPQEPRPQELMSRPRFLKEDLQPNQKFHFNEGQIYPDDGSEYQFEELNLIGWRKRRIQYQLVKRNEELMNENEELKQKLDVANQQIVTLTNALQQMHQMQQMQPSSRLSIVPQSLQPAMPSGQDADTSCYGGLNEAPSLVQDWWRNTIQIDKFTVPIDQSQYIRENVPTSTPNAHDKNKRSGANRRMSRPSMGGSPTMKLSPITETSREFNSKSSSSSSAISTAPNSTVKRALMVEPEPMIDEPDRPLDPNDPTTYRKLLRSLAEPLERRQGYERMNSTMPDIQNGVCFSAGSNGDMYLVDRELSRESHLFTAQILSDDSDQSDLSVKTICFRVDQPQNDWLFYICNELHRRLVRQKIQPDIELSVMNAEPAIMYSDGSILIDEYFRFVTIEDYITVCVEMNKQFPKSFAAYITLELLQLVKVLHDCDILHMNLVPKSLIITGCPTREDISSVGERTSIVKLIGFDYATDLRLLPCDHRFNTKLDHLVTCEMIDDKPWTTEVDWFGVLACVYKMFFLEEMEPVKGSNGRWRTDKQFKGFPTDIWPKLFDNLLNIQNMDKATSVIDHAIEELSVWIKANISFVLKEALALDTVLEDYCKATNKSVRI